MEQEFNDKIYKPDIRGYYRCKGIYMHRDVWEFFIGQIPKGYVVHHIDNNKANNDLSNLQMMTKAQHNKLHHIGRKCSIKTKRRISKAQKGKNNSMYGRNRKPVRCVETGEEFLSIKSACLKYKGNVNRAVNGLIKTAAGLHWEFIK